MVFFFISVLAGFLTVLAPCILPLLPIVIGTTEVGVRGLSRRSLTVIGSLSVSVIVFTLLLKASTLLIAIPQSFWQYFSGTVIVLVGVMMLFPAIWTKLPFVSRVSISGNKAVGAGYQKHSMTGDVLIGAALGPVFTTCSPTYLFIIATILPASFASGLFYLAGFVIGLAIALFLVAFFGERITSVLTKHMKTTENIKRGFGVIILIVGIAIMTGLDKRLETAILDAGYGATINFENALLERVTNDNIMDTKKPSSLKATEPPTSLEGLETITLAGGCFWCIEGALQGVPGVVSAVSGYAGGSEADAEYLTVAKGKTQHREAVQIVYDPKVVSTEALLNKFWASIDPVDAGGQFADRGFQYTTAIYYHTDEQKKIAEASKEALATSGLVTGGIATEVVPFTTFYPAEEYHQDYFLKSSDHYNRYKEASGREGFIEETWARDAAKEYFEGQEMKDKTPSTTEAKSREDYEYTDEEIQEKLAKLTPFEYHVVAEGGTESPFENAYWDNKAAGIYVDIVTGKPLFSSTHKYDSGTGWPSFWRTIDEDSVSFEEDDSLWMSRTEVRSDGGHVGHVFADGPAEHGGQRFCTNSASLRFVPKEDMGKEGYGKYLYLFEETAK